MSTGEAASEGGSPAEAIADRLFGEGLGAFHMMNVYLGVQLGLFAALAAHPGTTCAELARATGLDERYTEEWLQGECAAGLVDSDATDFRTGTVRLADGVREALVDEVHPAYLGGMSRAVAAIGQALPSLAASYRSGTGVEAAAYGPEIVAAQAALNRPSFVNDLAANWLPAIPDVHARLSDATLGARVADIGCGVGWAAIELAKAFPHARVDGLDVDAPSIAAAESNAREHGVADRVTFRLHDVAAESYGEGNYDAVFFFECLHDIGRPVEALAAARRAVAADGAVIVMDENTADEPQVGDPVETFFALCSALWCLPQSRVVPDCEAPGTVMRAATFESFARRAGWAGYDIVPIEHPVFRFYRLVA